ncbi:MAG: hypothetical protein LUQ07_05675 [Methanospirillum sp.]|nr:hypothetical protein [Methanospirillum sp.]
MSPETFLLFTDAARELVRQYSLRTSGKIRPEFPIIPVTCRLYATVGSCTRVSSLFDANESFPGIILSHLEDRDGIVPGTENMVFTVRASQQVTSSDLIPGMKARITILVTIQPPGTKSGIEWPIPYWHDGTEMFLGFRDVITCEKVS